MVNQVNTLYGNIDKALLARLSKVRLLVLDVDGVFSDGRIYLGNDGEELKAFHTRDGYGVKAVASCGIEVAVITGRQSHIVESRMQALKVKHIIQGQEDKKTALSALQSTLGLEKEQVMAVGDDMPDVGMFTLAGISAAVKDAHPFVCNQADIITTLPGGFGAVRELCDYLLQAHNQLEHIHGASV